MKWIKTVLCIVLLGATGAAVSRDEVTEAPTDYAIGVMLDTTDALPWYRISLPQMVYQSTAWPDLRDVRVFNHQGETVPFALVAQKNQTTMPETLALRLFPLEMSPVPAREEEQRSGDVVVLSAKSGIEIHLQSDDVNALGESYLLTPPEEMKDSISLAQLRLNWGTPAGNWQGKASVYVSHDLRDWQPVQLDVSLMDLAHDSERLKLDSISVNLTLSPEGNRFLLVILHSQSSDLAINSVNAIVDSNEPGPERIVIDALANKISDDEVVWRWMQPQPLESLQIDLENEGVLPVELAWRSNDKDSWHLLTKTLLYRLDGKHSENIRLPGHLVEAVQMRTIHARLPQTLPTLSGERDSYQLVFNTQGKGPYMLAWGNRVARKADIGLDMLLPASLRNTQEINELPWAHPQETVALGGLGRLTATSAAEQQSKWKTLLVWCALILGVVALSLITLRVWREVKQDCAA